MYSIGMQFLPAGKSNNNNSIAVVLQSVEETL